MIRWYEAFKIENGKVVEKIVFPPEERAAILRKLKMGDLSPLGKMAEGQKIKFEGEIYDIKELKSVAIQLVKEEMRERLSEDYILVEHLNTYDDIISIQNLIKERILEWKRIERIKDIQIDTLQLLHKELRELESLREYLYEKIEEEMQKIAPNITYMVGPIIGARLIADAGGLYRLARMPASTIQVLGAEDAFFRHLRSGSKCPKHGTIFRVPEVRNTSRKIRGKIARTLAAKLAIAAKIDYYGGKFMGDTLKKEWLKRVQEVGK